MQDDLRDATRMLRSQPGFAAAALLMLALGIGATTAIFTVVNAVLINPLPYPESDALVSIVHTVDGRDEPFFSDEIYNTYRETTSAFEDFGAEPERVTRLQQEMLQAIGSTPGVASAAFTTRLPMDTTGRTSAPIEAEGRPPDGRPISRQIRLVSPGLFQTLGTRLLAGRDFDWTDVLDRREVAIMSANLAREMWGSPPAAIGKRIRQRNTGTWREVVGVTGDLHDQGVHLPATATVFLPARLHAHTFARNFLPRRVSVVVRSNRRDFETFLGEIRKAVWAVNPNLPLAQVRSLGDLYGQSMARASFALVMLGIAAVMALLLGVFGIYGVISYAVSQRRREIGIRMALGAQAHEILGLFVRRGLIVTSVGMALGLAAAAGFTQVMRALLFGVSPLDPVAFAAVPVLLATASLIASYLPARRATSVDPIETIRVE